MKQLPFHFWQIHRRIYRQEWELLDWFTRKQILADVEGEIALGYYEYVMRLTEKFFLDGQQDYNSRYRFQYCP